MRLDVDVDADADQDADKDAAAKDMVAAKVVAMNTATDKEEMGAGMVEP